MGNTVIILDGPDGSGKTTLCKRLADDHGFRRLHEGVPPAGRDQLNYYATILSKALQAKWPVVFDRLHIGECVYGPVMRGYDDLGYTGLKLMHRLIEGQGVTVRICLPKFSTALANWRTKFANLEDYVNSESKFRDVYYRYKGLTGYYEAFDYEKNFDDQYTRMLATDEWSLPPGVIGARRARYLIVGEQPAGPLDWPFFSMQKSSGFLNTALWEAGFKEDEMAFANAINLAAKPVDLACAAARLSSFRVAIALGRIAEKACRDHNLHHVTLTHPAAMLRFRARKRAGFIRSLAAIRSRYAD